MLLPAMCTMSGEKLYIFYYIRFDVGIQCGSITQMFFGQNETELTNESEKYFGYNFEMSTHFRTQPPCRKQKITTNSTVSENISHSLCLAHAKNTSHIGKYQPERWSAVTAAQCFNCKWSWELMYCNQFFEHGHLLCVCAGVASSSSSFFSARSRCFLQSAANVSVDATVSKRCCYGHSRGVKWNSYK